MCHSRGLYLETTEKNTKQQQIAYNSQQWNYLNELMLEIFKGSYGEHYDFLLAELTEGPYWPLVKARLGQPQECKWIKRSKTRGQLNIIIIGIGGLGVRE